LHIAEGREQTAIFKFRATDKLGSEKSRSSRAQTASKQSAALR